MIFPAVGVPITANESIFTDVCKFGESAKLTFVMAKRRNDDNI